MRVLVAEESRLFEFRAIGGRVELSIRANDMFIGTVLRSLEVEDLVCCEGRSQPCYLARSFIQSTDVPSFPKDTDDQTSGSNDLGQFEGDDKFYEASEDLNDFVKPPSFSRVNGLLPSDIIHAGNDNMEVTDTLDSFVKAQIVIYDQKSLRYRNIDKRVTVMLATLSLFCRRPTILAIIEFTNAINIEDGSCESFSDNSSTVIRQNDTSREDEVDNQQSAIAEAPPVKGLLGKGKSRIMFYLTVKMARAQILLMKENGSKLATLSQDHFLTDIKVFPSSFSIKASLGNLRISDDSLCSSHMYFWVCDMRDPGGTSFVELVFSSYSADDEDYEGYDYSLIGQLSEVRIVYLNRFIQEVVSYFMGLVPNNSKDVVRVNDQVSNSEKWFTTSEIDGSPAVKLNLSLRKPVILMPRRTDSLDYLKLDIVHITVQNTFCWFSGSKNEMNAVHLEILTVLVEDINLNVGTGAQLGESIIQDVKGVYIVFRRSLRDLSHQIPSTEVAVKIEELKAALSNREYQIITECALANFSETPNIIPPLNIDYVTSVDMRQRSISRDSDAAKSDTQDGETWIAMKVSVVVDLVELCLHYGLSRDAPLATVQASGIWLLYKSSTLGEGFLSATLKDFTVIDDRSGTEQELRLAIRKPENIVYSPLQFGTEDDDHHLVETNVDGKPVPTMLILDVKLSHNSTFVSLNIQRPQLLVALDFLLAVVEFFVPTVRSMLSDEEDENFLHLVDALILDQSTYSQPSPEFSLFPRRPLVVDDERYDHFIYDGRDGTLYLKDRRGLDLSSPSKEPIIYMGNGKRLQFKNVTIKNGQYLDSCILLGSNSSYSASEDDKVYLRGGDEGPPPNSLEETTDGLPSQTTVVNRFTEFTIELQVKCCFRIIFFITLLVQLEHLI
ncbi:unnamed protein product [Ilex paraguariensis]|uniref:Uncharacterized protein n=1 Tax=Ilex paraguariensis TaxID=185542 RepID=A0ABC8TW70_9AQUA